MPNNNGLQSFLQINYISNSGLNQTDYMQQKDQKDNNKEKGIKKTDSARFGSDSGSRNASQVQDDDCNNTDVANSINRST